MSPGPRKDPVAVETEVREKIHLEILKRTGAYHANDHVLLPSGQHTSEYIEKTLVTTEPSFTEGLGAVIAKHFAPWPVDVVLSTWPRTSVELTGKPAFSPVSRDFPTDDPEECPLCKKGVPLNEEFVRRRHARRPSSVHEPKAAL